MEYTITIQIQDVWDEARKISSYEARDAVNAAGEVDYEKVHLTEQDKEYFRKIMREGALDIEKQLSRLVASMEISDAQRQSQDTEGSEDTMGTVTFVFALRGARCSQETLRKMLVEALSSLIISLWLTGRKDGKVQFYANLYANMIMAITKVLTRKKAPVLEED